jgi:hypothetical protein
MLLTQTTGRKLAEVLDIPELQVELERAIWQVETTIQKQPNESAKAPAAESDPKREKE